MKILAGKLYTPTKVIDDAYISINDGKITEITQSKARPDLSFPIVAPGLIDTHTHGAVGVDAMKLDKDGLTKLSIFYAKHGVTSFLLTTVSDTFENTLHICEAASNLMNEFFAGAKLVGLHMEGPYLNPSKKGAHKEQYLKNPDMNELQELVSKYGKIIKVFTIAPELQNSMQAIRFLSENKIVVTLGHTDADYETALKAIGNGAKRATHVFNAMRSFSHRDPGIIGAVLTDDRVFCEVICDFIHLHPCALDLVIKAKGFRRTVLVSDSMSATGLNDGEYELGDLQVTVKNGVAKLKGSETLAGSTLTLDQAVSNLVFRMNYKTKDVIRMATLNASIASGLNLGRIAVGSIADLVCLDENLMVVATVVNGKVVYSV